MKPSEVEVRPDPEHSDQLTARGRRGELFSAIPTDAIRDMVYFHAGEGPRKPEVAKCERSPSARFPRIPSHRVWVTRGLDAHQPVCDGCHWTKEDVKRCLDTEVAEPEGYLCGRVVLIRALCANCVEMGVIQGKEGFIPSDE